MAARGRKMCYRLAKHALEIRTGTVVCVDSTAYSTVCLKRSVIASVRAKMAAVS